MSDIYVIYWSGTGNTEMMAGAVAEGIHAAGGHANVLDVASASADVLKDAKAFALGCPAMGSEQLEEGDMEPFVEEVENSQLARPSVCSAPMTGAMATG